jgi:hypothetical protein
MIETRPFERRVGSFRNDSPGFKVLLVTPVQTGVQRCYGASGEDKA